MGKSKTTKSSKAYTLMSSREQEKILGTKLIVITASGAFYSEHVMVSATRWEDKQKIQCNELGSHPTHAFAQALALMGMSWRKARCEAQPHTRTPEDWKRTARLQAQQVCLKKMRSFGKMVC